MIAGGLSPFGISTAVAPLAFMRDLLCVSDDPRPRPTCSTSVHFDIWSAHPYTAGGPTHQRRRRRRRLGRSAAGDEDGARRGRPCRARRLEGPGPVLGHGVLVGQRSTRPRRHPCRRSRVGGWPRRCTSMWSAGVSLVTWFTLRDQPFRTSPYQSGLYYLGPSFAKDRPKPALTAFRFPFVAFLHGSRIAVWGRTPAGRRGTVRVEQHVPAGWTHVATLRANAVGIFAASLEAHGRGPLRAEYPADGTSSLPFSLEVPLDHPYQPFGAPLPTTAALLGGPASSAVSQYVEVAPGAGGSPGAGGTGGAAAGAASALTGARADAVPGSALAAGVDAIGSVGGRALVSRCGADRADRARVRDGGRGSALGAAPRRARPPGQPAPLTERRAAARRPREPSRQPERLLDRAGGRGRSLRPRLRRRWLSGRGPDDRRDRGLVDRAPGLRDRGRVARGAAAGRLPGRRAAGAVRGLGPRVCGLVAERGGRAGRVRPDGALPRRLHARRRALRPRPPRAAGSTGSGSRSPPSPVSRS